MDIGRPVTDIASELLYPGLADDSAKVIATLAAVEREILARNGQWFCVRVMHYRTNDNIIDGVVITFSNISRMKRLESALEEGKRR